MEPTPPQGPIEIDATPGAIEETALIDRITAGTKISYGKRNYEVIELPGEWNKGRYEIKNLENSNIVFTTSRERLIKMLESGEIKIISAEQKPAPGPAESASTENPELEPEVHERELVRDLAYEQALRIVSGTRTDKEFITASALRQKLGIDPGRAARILADIERDGIIDGKSGKILLTHEEIEKFIARHKFVTTPEPEAIGKGETVGFCRVCGKPLEEAGAQWVLGRVFCIEHVPPTPKFGPKTPPTLEKKDVLAEDREALGRAAKEAERTEAIKGLRKTIVYAKSTIEEEKRRMEERKTVRERLRAELAEIEKELAELPKETETLVREIIFPEMETIPTMEGKREFLERKRKEEIMNMEEIKYIINDRTELLKSPRITPFGKEYSEKTLRALNDSPLEYFLNEVKEKESWKDMEGYIEHCKGVIEEINEINAKYDALIVNLGK
jgi:hypothetical protein